MSWSIKGANNLAKILAEKASKRIYKVIDEVCCGVILTEFIMENFNKEISH
ncbi:hypothetical protein [Clostridium sp. AWRP]|uniref:hypothetical protein n=1 Tax=Clostridium sp. AWRP TaxID=2212991 RepID=UPI0015863F39|nr:hypothetical protein [Clostridium sp. AWRP]